MSDIMNNPDCAEGTATLAACVLREILALARSVERAHSDHLSSDMPILANLVVQHAERWVHHFEEQGEMHQALREQQRRGQA